MYPCGASLAANSSTRISAWLRRRSVSAQASKASNFVRPVFPARASATTCDRPMSRVWLRRRPFFQPSSLRWLYRRLGAPIWEAGSKRGSVRKVPEICLPMQGLASKRGLFSRPKCGQHRLKSVEFNPTFADIGPTWVELGPGFGRVQTNEIGQHAIEIDRVRKISARF